MAVNLQPVARGAVIQPTGLPRGPEIWWQRSNGSVNCCSPENNLCYNSSPATTFLDPLRALWLDSIALCTTSLQCTGSHHDCIWHVGLSWHMGWFYSQIQHVGLGQHARWYPWTNRMLDVSHRLTPPMGSSLQTGTASLIWPTGLEVFAPLS